MVAGGETIHIILKEVAFVQVLDGFAEVDGVGGVFCQRLLELHDDGLVFQLDVGFFFHRRRNHHLLFGIVEGDVFVEGDFDFLANEVGAMVFGHTANDHRRCGVLRAASGSHGVGATLGEEGHEEQPEAKNQIFQFVNHGAKVVIFVVFLFYSSFFLFLPLDLILILL